MQVECHRGIMANEHITVGGNAYEKEKTFKYLASLLTNQNSVNGEIRRKLKAKCWYYYETRTLFYSRKI
jgi:hypothetical protein